MGFFNRKKKRPSDAEIFSGTLKYLRDQIDDPGLWIKISLSENFWIKVEGIRVEENPGHQFKFIDSYDEEIIELSNIRIWLTGTVDNELEPGENIWMDAAVNLGDTIEVPSEYVLQYQNGYDQAEMRAAYEAGEA